MQFVHKQGGQQTMYSVYTDIILYMTDQETVFRYSKEKEKVEVKV